MALDNRQKVLEKAVDLAFAARSVIDQLTNRDGTPEGRKARELLEMALSKAITDPDSIMVGEVA